jgi:hypothetical protein
MTRRRVSAVLIGTAVALGFALQAPAFAQIYSSPATEAGQQAIQQQAVTTFAKEHLKTSALQWTAGGGSLSSGFNLVFQTKVSCPAKATECTVGFEDMLQVGESSASGNRWAICAKIDGNFVHPPCPFQGIVPTSSFFVTGNSLQMQHVATGGSHTVQVYVYVDAAATVGNSTAIYRVYKP